MHRQTPPFASLVYLQIKLRPIAAYFWTNYKKLSTWKLQAAYNDAEMVQ